MLLLFLRRGGDSALLGMDLFSEKKNVSVGEVGGQHYFVFRFVAGRGTEVGWNFEQLLFRRDELGQRLDRRRGRHQFLETAHSPVVHGHAPVALADGERGRTRGVSVLHSLNNLNKNQSLSE